MALNEVERMILESTVWDLLTADGLVSTTERNKNGERSQNRRRITKARIGKGFSLIEIEPAVCCEHACVLLLVGLSAWNCSHWVASACTCLHQLAEKSSISSIWGPNPCPWSMYIIVCLIDRKLKNKSINKSAWPSQVISQISSLSLRSS